ncbi:mannose-6-phosphate isomerase, class I [Peribacillus sp. NPDC097198]|uniref:mannose-6-phosphate isomerase, class I n=1 Tax=Peribacillus sp. NPDC097198 TaxID=3364397 RepID=UPI0037FDB79E
MNEPIFLTPSFQERIWGGTKLKSIYQYDIPSAQTGECWAISGHENGESTVISGEYSGEKLSDLWENHPELFGFYHSEKFPLLIKILDANYDLSVQVHPDDFFAKSLESDELGKTECWYIIDCEEDAEIVFGHHAQTKTELVTMIENNQWDDLLHRVKVHPGDFFYVPSGTVHAIGKGTLVLETQQSSDTTYRVYDYNRTGPDGERRELHLEKAVAVATVPHITKKVEPKICRVDEATITTFVEDQYFSVHKWEVHNRIELVQDQPFMLVSVLEGNGTIQVNHKAYPIKKGQHFILPYRMENFILNGFMSLIVSHP